MNDSIIAFRAKEQLGKFKEFIRDFLTQRRREAESAEMAGFAGPVPKDSKDFSRVEV